MARNPSSSTTTAEAVLAGEASALLLASEFLREWPLSLRRRSSLDAERAKNSLMRVMPELAGED